MSLRGRIRIGCAGWTIPAPARELFGDGPSHLARYATRFSTVEINSSFYRPHRPATYARWAESTPPDFRFAVKVPKRITHELRLRNFAEEFHAFLAGPQSLGNKLGLLLVQLPPSLALERDVADDFFAIVRGATNVAVACEPRHRSWFEPDAEDLLRRYAVVRVAADPACTTVAAEPGGDHSLVYYRLHGSPQVYYSNYDEPYLQSLADTLQTVSAAGCDCWCIFDNTARGAATENGLRLSELTSL